MALICATNPIATDIDAQLGHQIRLIAQLEILAFDAPKQYRKRTQTFGIIPVIVIILVKFGNKFRNKQELTKRDLIPFFICMRGSKFLINKPASIASIWFANGTFQPSTIIKLQSRANPYRHQKARDFARKNNVKMKLAVGLD